MSSTCLSSGVINIKRHIKGEGVPMMMTTLLFLILGILLSVACNAFIIPAVSSHKKAVLQPSSSSSVLSKTSPSTTSSLTLLSSSTDEGELQHDAAARAKIEEIIKNNKIVLFMKGSKMFPSCGFSNTACSILNRLQVEYETVDVLADERVRAEIKRYSAWPTIPQLYLQGEFVGGSDILLEMYQTGELQEMIEIAAAS